MSRFCAKRPCSDCPFLREGGIRLTRARIKQIAGGMLDSQGISFDCHKTLTWDETDDGDELVRGAKSKACAGAIIFADKNDNHTQFMRVAGRLGMWNPDDMEGRDEVFEDLDEMLATAVDGRRGRRAAR